MAAKVLNTANFKASRAIAAWLLACCAMIFVMVILGGLTRLTHSGLSMVEWQPLSVLPPITETEWEATFAKYRLSPEFRLVNADMTLEGFKGIFWLEYIHRLWGRAIGVVFALPLVFFAWRGLVNRPLLLRLAGILVLGGLQGLMGWVMVKSGLVDQPDVSHYRLAAHLMLAFAILALILWTALDLLPRGASPAASTVWTPAAFLVAMVALTATWGAFVAGLDAGLVYNTFPLMNGRAFPDEALTSPLALNFLESHGWVQFAHRVLAISTVLLASGLWLKARRDGLSGRPRATLAATAAWAWVQAGMGVATLLMQVPVPLASAHQAGALVLLALAVAHLHALAPGRTEAAADSGARALGAAS